MFPAVTHHAFSDETHHNKGRFRGIAAVTAPVQIAAEAAQSLRHLLTAGGVKELKWEKIRTARERLAAIHLLDWLFKQDGRLRADVLTWDTEDARHRVCSRDDQANLHRMYHHLFRNVLQRRWPKGSVWKLYPDEQDSMDWNKVHDVLYAVSIKPLEKRLTDGPGAKLSWEVFYRIVQIVPSHSDAEPLIQLADLLAGMSAFSRSHLSQFLEWEESASGQMSLVEREPDCLSTGEKEKCSVLSHFYDKCRSSRLQISLQSSKGLSTRNPRTFLNFWHYVPQRVQDRAPLRKHATAS